MAKIPTQFPSVDRLKSQLMTSSLQESNTALFQVIDQLIDALRQTIQVTDTKIDALTSGGGGTTNITNIIGGNIGLIPLDGPEGPEGLIGPIGPIGPQGTQGIPGPSGFDAEEPEISLIPGPIGPQGPAGGGGGGSATIVETNVGSTPIWRGKFTITDAAISPTSKIIIQQASGPYTGKGTRADEAEMDPLFVYAEPGSGQAIAKWQTLLLITENILSVSHRTITLNFQQQPSFVTQARRYGRVRGNIKFQYMVL